MLTDASIYIFTMQANKNPNAYNRNGRMCQSVLEFGASKLALTACRRQAERTTGKASLAGQSKL
jgi:hypothetical protein